MANKEGFFSVRCEPQLRRRLDKISSMTGRRLAAFCRLAAIEFAEKEEARMKRERKEEDGLITKKGNPMRTKEEKAVVDRRLEQMFQQDRELIAEGRAYKYAILLAVRMLKGRRKLYQHMSSNGVADFLLKEIQHEWCDHCNTPIPAAEMCSNPESGDSMCSKCRDELALEADREAYSD